MADKIEGPGLLIAAFGRPGPFAARGFRVIEAIASRVFGDVIAVAVDTREALLAGLADHPGRPVLVTSNYPHPCLSAFASAHAAYRVVFHEGAGGAARHLAATTAETEMGVIRAVSASCACVASLPEPAQWTIFRDTDFKVDGHGALSRRLATLLAVDLEEASSSEPSPDADVTLTGLDPDITSRLDRLAVAILAPFDGLGCGRDESPFVWPQECLLKADDLGSPLTGELDLAGPARCVAYGPYLHLPVGRWEARIVFGFDANLYEQSFALELHGSERLGRIRVAAPAEAGLFAAQVPFLVEEPHKPIELRLFSERGAIEGRITKISITLHRIGVPVVRNA